MIDIPGSPPIPATIDVVFAVHLATVGAVDGKFVFFASLEERSSVVHDDFILIDFADYGDVTTVTSVEIDDVANSEIFDVSDFATVFGVF